MIPPIVTPVMADARATTAIRHRLRVTQLVDGQLPTHRNSSAGANDVRASVYAVGGGVKQRRDFVRDKMKERTPDAKTEQRVPMCGAEKELAAILDVYHPARSAAARGHHGERRRAQQHRPGTRPTTPRSFEAWATPWHEPHPLCC